MNSWHVTQPIDGVLRIQHAPDERSEGLALAGLSGPARAALANAEVVSVDAAGLAELLRSCTSDGGLELDLRAGADGVYVRGALEPQEALYGACDADARGLDRRGDHVHLRTELHPVGRADLDGSDGCDLCADVVADHLDRRAAEARSRGMDPADLPDSNYGELVVPWFWSSRGYGIYVANQSTDAVLDLGARDPDQWSFTADRGPAEVWVVGPASLAEATSRLAWLLGHQALPPHWTLGYIQSRFGYESFEHAQGVVDRLIEEQVPVHGLVFDVLWLNDYVDLQWHPERFPNPVEGLGRLAAAGVRSIVITEPMIRTDIPSAADGERIGAFATRTGSDDPYAADPWYCARGIEGFLPLEPSPGRLLNFFRDEVGTWWCDQHTHLREMGVDAWWLDLNEPEGVGTGVSFPDADWPHPGTLDGRDVRNMLAVAQQRQFARHDDGAGVRRFVLSRSGGAGSQRYGASPWTGDIGSTWTDLARQPRLVMNLGLCGLPLAGCDLGGFFGEPGPELMARFLQAGALMPIMRAHGCLTDREPWSQGEEALPHVAAAIRLRGRLLPQVVSWAYEASRDGRPIMRPMVMDHPGDARCADVDDQWMFGSLLAAPVLEPGARSRTVLIPEGQWIQLQVQPDGMPVPVGDPIDGPCEVEVPVQPDTIPIFLPAGAALVLDPEPLARRSYEWPPPRLEVLAASPAAHGTTIELLLDDGTTPGREPGSLRIEVTAEPRVTAEGLDVPVPHIDLAPTRGTTP